MKSKQLVRKLNKLGAEIIKGRGKGGHLLVKFCDKQTTIPIHGNVDLGPVFIKLICKQLGINPESLV